MTQQPHDQFAKQFLEELFIPLDGKVKVNFEIHAERRYVDIYFEPKATTTSTPLFKTLGLLGQMIEHTCLLEPFRSPPTINDVNNCILKLLSVHNKLQTDRSRHDEKPLPQEQLPRLWILATSASEPLLNSYAAQPDLLWGKGVYFLQEPLLTAIVAIDRLPTTPQTLYLRMLGKGSTQQRAIEEFFTLFPQTEPLGKYVLELLAKYRIQLETLEQLTEEEEDLFMNLESVYLKWKEDTRLEGQRVLIEQMLKARFGTLDDILSSLIESLLKLKPEDSSRLLLQASREELVAKLSH